MSAIRNVVIGILIALLLASVALLSRTCGSIVSATGSYRAAGVDEDTAVPESYFGMHIHRAVPTARFPVPCAWPDVGFYGWRLWDASVSWPALEPSPGQWAFTTLDSCVALADQEGAEILLPLGLTPAWASSRPDEASAYGPGNAAPPRDLENWRTYVRAVASRYRGRIKHYEIWNEPNLPRFFSGSSQEMLGLASEAYRILKDVDPENVVVSPSATSGEAGLRWLEGYLGEGGHDVCDVVGFHFYTGGQPPETIRRLALLARRVLDRTGAGSKPLWNTETGWTTPSQFPADGASNIQEQRQAASYLSRALISAWAGGVKRFYWYAWDNFKMGLTEADGKTEKPAAVAYRVTRRWLLGTRMKDWYLGSTDVYSVTLERPDGRLRWIAWTGAGNGMFRVPGDWKAVRIEDLTGMPRPLSDFVDGIDIRVSPSPILIEGDRP